MAKCNCNRATRCDTHTIAKRSGEDASGGAKHNGVLQSSMPPIMPTSPAAVPAGRHRRTGEVSSAEPVGNARMAQCDTPC